MDFGWPWGPNLHEWWFPCISSLVWWTEDGTTRRLYAQEQAGARRGRRPGTRGDRHRAAEAARSAPVRPVGAPACRLRLGAGRGQTERRRDGVRATGGHPGRLRPGRGRPASAPSAPRSFLSPSWRADFDSAAAGGYDCRRFPHPFERYAMKTLREGEGHQVRRDRLRRRLQHGPRAPQGSRGVSGGTRWLLALRQAAKVHSERPGLDVVDRQDRLSVDVADFRLLGVAVVFVMLWIVPKFRDDFP